MVATPTLPIIVVDQLKEKESNRTIIRNHTNRQFEPDIPNEPGRI